MRHRGGWQRICHQAQHNRHGTVVLDLPRWHRLCAEAGIAVDGFGDAYVTGNALTIDFPTTNGAFQTLNKAAAAVNANPTAYLETYL